MLANLEHSIVELDMKNDGGILSSLPENIGPRLETRLGGAALVSRPPGSMSFRSNAEFAAVILAPVPNMESAFASDQLEKFHAPVGMLVVNPSSVDRQLKWATSKQNVAVAFGHAAYAELAARELDGGRWELQPPKFGHVDQLALRLAKALAAETIRPVANLLYLDSLLTIFGVHLIRKYSNAKVASAFLSSRRLAGQTSTKLLNYMNDNLNESITIGDLAKIARLSPSHFIRAFTSTFSMPPHQYLLSLRLKKAEELLIKTQIPISEIAFQAGFSSQSHLSNAMKRVLRVTPGKIRSSSR